MIPSHLSLFSHRATWSSMLKKDRKENTEVETPNWKLPAGSRQVVLPFVCYRDRNWGIILATEFIQTNPKKRKENRKNKGLPDFFTLPFKYSTCHRKRLLLL